MSTAYNAQFFQLDFRLIDDPDFLAFLHTRAFAVYLLLARHIWRGRRPHSIRRVNELRREGCLVAVVDREVIMRRLGVGRKRYVSRLVGELEKRDLIRRERTGRQSVYVLGTWEDRSHAGDGSCIVEVLYLHQHFGPDRLPQIPLDESEVHKSCTSEVHTACTSEVHTACTSEVHKPCTSEAEVHKPCTSEVHESCTSFLIDKGIDKRERSDDLSLRRREARLAEVLRRHGRQPPDRGTLGDWLALCHGDADLAVATLSRLGHQGHLADKPIAYISTALERDAAARSQAVADMKTLYEDDDDDEGVYVVRARPAAGRA